MSEFSDIKKSLSRYEALERELHLKQLQINRLLNITQAINNKVKADGLFQMYTDFLSWEMGIRKMALFFRDQERWACKASIGWEQPPFDGDIEQLLQGFTRLQNLDEPDHPFLKEFDVVIPVRHKDLPLAYVFIGGFDADEDMFNKVQFITTITNVIAVAIENKRLFKRQLEQEKLKHEMELASQFQQMLLPKTLPANQYYELDSVYRPHLNVG
ncbi:MAG: serine/threonine protein phosphatase, partial [Bacteroidetes bacterium]